MRLKAVTRKNEKRVTVCGTDEADRFEYNGNNDDLQNNISNINSILQQTTNQEKSIAIPKRLFSD